MPSIVIRGARQHNLKGIDVTLPREALIAVTGVSGSGKSSLAFDTLYAEGERRYLESLSSFARAVIGRAGAPDVDSVSGLSPAIAIEQRGLPKNPRSTVGTLTEIHDRLRLLFARLGTVHCLRCGAPVRAHTIPRMVEDVMALPGGSRVLVLAPLGEVAAAALQKLAAGLRRRGFARVRVDGEVLALDPPPRLKRKPAYRVEVVVDRVVVGPEARRRLADSLELASRTADRSAVVAVVGGEELAFSEHFRCAACGAEASEPTMALFSFHHPTGACPACGGLGTAREGKDTGAPCPECGGSRFSPAARAVRLGGLGLHEVSALALPETRDWASRLPLGPTEALIASRPVAELIERLSALENLGLSYLSLDRAAASLSGGEAQRLRLAREIASPLSGVLYVLDEPSVGLHPRDHERLMEKLAELREAGNTVVVVEHDLATIRAADWVVDMGPGAGERGGELLYSGPPGGLPACERSLTGAYLSGRLRIEAPEALPPPRDFLRVEGARGHTLKDITARFPLARMSCVTGVSGSGKSTLVLETLFRALAARLHAGAARPLPFSRIEGAEALERVLHVDQSPLGRTPRSIPATAAGVFSLIRELFSRLPEARARGYGPERFSFNVRGGRCETCRGEGVQRIEMVFLPDVLVTCPRCEGARYNAETLDIRWKGLSVAEVLALSVTEAAALFEHLPAIRARLQVLSEVGLGYLRLGQPGTTLSGGEAQRVKLAAELGRRAAGRTLYILDEPTRGLHQADIARLLSLLRRLVAQGNTVIVIEHNLSVARACDWIVDMGPEGGEAGGRVVAEGTPENITARAGESVTGRYLAEALEQEPSRPLG